jgi:type III pantothenate kinase
MILTLDVGNTQIFGGLFKGQDCVLTFRKTSSNVMSSDEYGLFFKSVLEANGFNTENVDNIAISSVVPSSLYSINSACIKYFKTTPLVLKPGIKTGLKIKYKNPAEVGADRIANAMAAVKIYTKQPIIVVDLGTATTLDAITSDGEYLGGAIIAGLKISAEALETKTAKLPSVEIRKPESALGQTTIESIQSGLYYSHLGAMKEIIANFKSTFPSLADAKVIGTGGLAHLFKSESVFNTIETDLVHKGLLISVLLNEGANV